MPQSLDRGVVLALAEAERGLQLLIRSQQRVALDAEKPRLH